MIWDETDWVEERYNKLKKDLLIARLCKLFTWFACGLLTILACILGYELYMAFTVTHILLAAFMYASEIFAFIIIAAIYKDNNRLLTFLKDEIQDYKELLDEWKSRKMD